MQAAASTDLGGIEYARQRKVITIGLATISYNPDVVALVFAAGDSKAAIVAKAVEAEVVSQRYPNTSTHVLCIESFDGWYMHREQMSLVVHCISLRMQDSC